MADLDAYKVGGVREFLKTATREQLNAKSEDEIAEMLSLVERYPEETPANAITPGSVESVLSEITRTTEIPEITRAREAILPIGAKDILPLALEVAPTLAAPYTKAPGLANFVKNLVMATSTGEMGRQAGAMAGLREDVQPLVTEEGLDTGALTSAGKRMTGDALVDAGIGGLGKLARKGLVDMPRKKILPLTEDPKELAKAMGATSKMLEEGSRSDITSSIKHLQDLSPTDADANKILMSFDANPREALELSMNKTDEAYNKIDQFLAEQGGSIKVAPSDITNHEKYKKLLSRANGKDPDVSQRALDVLDKLNKNIQLKATPDKAIDTGILSESGSKVKRIEKGQLPPDTNLTDLVNVKRIFDNELSSVHSGGTTSVTYGKQDLYDVSNMLRDIANNKSDELKQLNKDFQAYKSASQALSKGELKFINGKAKTGWEALKGLPADVIESIPITPSTRERVSKLESVLSGVNPRNIQAGLGATGLSGNEALVDAFLSLRGQPPVMTETREEPGVLDLLLQQLTR